MVESLVYGLVGLTAVGLVVQLVVKLAVQWAHWMGFERAEKMVASMVSWKVVLLGVNLADEMACLTVDSLAL
jgi:hypothetical protein